MQDSRSSVNDVSRYVGWLIAGLVIFTLSCSSGMFISFCTAIGLAASIRNSQLSPIFAYVLEGIAMTLAGGTVSGIISAFLGNLLFQSELAAHRRRYRMVVLGTLIGYIITTCLFEVCNKLSLAPINFIFATGTFIGGGIAGLLQWQVLRRVVRGAWIWIPIVAVSWTIVSLIFLSIMSFLAMVGPLD